jgi:hypothetical protein
MTGQRFFHTLEAFPHSRAAKPLTSTPVITQTPRGRGLGFRTDSEDATNTQQLPCESGLVVSTTAATGASAATAGNASTTARVRPAATAGDAHTSAGDATTTA